MVGAGLLPALPPWDTAAFPSQAGPRLALQVLSCKMSLQVELVKSLELE